MNRFTRGIAMASARHPWRTIASWVVVLGAVFALASSGGGTFIDEFSAQGSQSERAMRLLQAEFPGATQARALVVFAAEDGESLQGQQRAVDAVLAEVAPGLTMLWTSPTPSRPARPLRSGHGPAQRLPGRETGLLDPGGVVASPSMRAWGWETA